MAISQPRLRVVPCSIARAKELVDFIHRHHGASIRARFAVAVADEDGLVRGVALVGHPVARLLDDGWTLEVSRVATDGCPNACSSLYGAARRIAKGLGYSRLITYIRDDEPGTSVNAAGFTFEWKTLPQTWDRPNRKRMEKTEIIGRQRWGVETGAAPIPLVWPEIKNDQMNFGEALGG